MIATTLKQSATDIGPGFVLDKKTLTSWLDQINEKALVETGQAVCTSWKREATEQILLRMPESSFNMSLAHYRQFTWERSCFNTEILRTAVWGHLV